MKAATARFSYRRTGIALFFGVVACGVCFYVVTFLGLIVELFSGPLNPAETPHFAEALKFVAAPLSITLGALAFLMAWLRLGKSRVRSIQQR